MRAGRGFCILFLFASSSFLPSRTHCEFSNVVRVRNVREYNKAKRKKRRRNNNLSSTTTHYIFFVFNGPTHHRQCMCERARVCVLFSARSSFILHFFFFRFGFFVFAWPVFPRNTKHENKINVYQYCAEHHNQRAKEKTEYMVFHIPNQLTAVCRRGCQYFFRRFSFCLSCA